MRLATYRHGGSVHVGVVADGAVRSLEGVGTDRPLATMLDVINGFDEVSNHADPVARATAHPLPHVELLAPYPGRPATSCASARTTGTMPRSSTEAGSTRRPPARSPRRR